MKKYILIALCASILASCNSSRNAKSFKRLDSDKFHGYYKVGNPYEIDGQWYTPREQPDYDEVGISSWYGDKFHGKQTANGDTFDKHSLTAAHNTLPLPSMVRVTNLENNKTLILMVNDRGPFAKGRVIDVSERAADILGYKDKGIAKVRVQFLKGHTKRLLSDLPIAPDKPKNKFSFFDREEAEDMYDDDLETNGDSPLDLMPGISREDVMRPAKKLAEVMNNKITKPLSNLPKINIKSSEKQIAQPQSEEINAAEEATTDSNSLESINDESYSEVEITTEDSLVEDELSEIPSDDEIKFIETNTLVQNTAPAKLQQKSDITYYLIQAGTYSLEKNAQRVSKKLEPLGDIDIEEIIIAGKTLYRVSLGPITDMDIANLALKKVIKLGHADAMLIKK